jgi:rubrerythrin
LLVRQLLEQLYGKEFLENEQLLSRQFLEDEHLLGNQSLEDCLRNCFNSESLDAGSHEFLAEIAAREGVSVSEVRRKLSLLFSKGRQLAEVRDVIRKLGNRTTLFTSSHRRLKKSLKQRLIPLALANEIIADIVDEFWNYLSADLHETLREMKASLLEIDAKTPIIQAERWLRYHGRLPDLTKKRYRFYKSVSRLRLSLLKARDTESFDELLIEEDQHQAEKLSKLFDKAMESALNDPSHHWEVYTEEMAAEDDELTRDVLIDD